MKLLWMLICLVFIFLPNEQCAGQLTPQQLVPVPDFADYHAEMSAEFLKMSGQMEDMDVMESSVYDGRRYIRYEPIGMDVQVYTTSRSIHEVRGLYIDLILKSLRDRGMPPEALDEYGDFLEYEAIETVEDEPVLDFDLDLVESHYRESGLTEIVKWFECYRELQPQISDAMKETFMFEMDELQFRRTDEIQDGMNYYIVEVEVSQPYVDMLECRLVEDTLIIYNIYRMVVSIE
ncbi:MAG: hypothetical protein R6U22_11650 [Desulfohalobiaceae bacterium]